MNPENDIPYACPKELMFAPAELDNLPTCEWCYHPCVEIFMRVFSEQENTLNYCSVNCLHRYKRLHSTDGEHKNWMDYAMSE